MKIKSKNLIFLGIVTLSLPFILFSIFWFKIYIGVPILLLVVYSLDKIILKKKEANNREYIIKVPYLIFAFMFILLILIFGGHGEWWSQHESDWPVRYAVYRDLVNFEWPVVYSDNSFLCYYFGYFLPPAYVTKFIIIFINDTIVSNKIMMQVELLWGAYITFLSFLLILDFIQKKSKGFDKNINIQEVMIVLFIFIFFSGLDVVGSKFFAPASRSFIDWKVNIDVWSYKWFPCTMSNLWDAFNQCIMFYLLGILVFMQEDLNIILYLAGVSFISLIFPLFGLALLCIPLLIKRIKNIKELISLPNIIGLIAVFISIVFIMCQKGFAESESTGFPLRMTDNLLSEWKHCIVFLILEFYIYFILLFKKNHRDNIYIASGLTILIFVFFEYKNGENELALRCSMPAIYYMLILSAKEMIDFYHDKKIEVSRVLLIIVLIIGVGTPICDIARNIKYSKDNDWIPVIHDEQYSFSDDKKYTFDTHIFSQYKGYNYKDSIFHKTVGR